MQKRLKRLNNRELGLIALTLVAAIGAYSKYYYLSTGKLLSELEQKLNDVELQAKRDLSLVQELQQRMTASIQKGDGDKQLKPFVDSSQRFAQVIEKLATESKDLITKGVSLQKSDKEKELRSVLLQIELEGTFPAIGAFVERFESSNAIAEIESIDISRDHTDLTKCIAKIQIKSYLVEEEVN